MRKTLLTGMYMVALFSCKKKEDLPEAPVISFDSISHAEVVQFDNQITIRIRFQDSDGDIGEPNPDINSLEVKDARLQNYDSYHVPPMTPNLQQLQIEGTLTVQLGALFLLGSGNQEVTSFAIRLFDRKGNRSNEIVTPEVIIKKTP